MDIQPPPMMGMRLIMLMAMGLGAMYMLHLLAMDFMRIRRTLTAVAPAAAAVGRVLIRGKRDAQPYITTVDFNDFQNSTIITLNDRIHLKQFNDDMIKFNWNRLINNDPLGCLPSLVCQIVSDIDTNLTEEAVNIRKFIEFSYNTLPYNIRSAYNSGLIFLNEPEKCYSEYPFCIYSGKTMLKILKWFLEYIV